MRPLGGRGFTLIELLVVLALTGVILGAIYQSIGLTQRAMQTQVQRLHVQQDTRTALLFLTYALRELDAVDGDLVQAEDTAVVIRSPRWGGVLCTVPQPAIGGVSFVMRDEFEFGVRPPDADLDSLLLFRDGDVSMRSDDQWLIGGVLAASAATCADGAPGTLVRTQISAASGGNDSALVGVTAGSPVRGFQRERITLYQDGQATHWLGRQTLDRVGAWTEVEAVVGPLTADGLALTYFNADGAPAVNVTDIASVAVVVRGRSPQPARLLAGGIGYIRDSVIGRVTLRNNRGF